MNRLEQDAADALLWHERQERHKQGYGPRPSEPVLRTWAPVMSAQQQAEFEQYRAAENLPF